ncbi:6-hydroxymethylpterin diphosphokinase MptE-like protein [Anaeromusa sp.]|uniref:motility associated factor glycosyltransferase family protein n=1 Tax=Anaeromusa sp. TaxID=1872520 RepID=UPI00262963A7|nr:6-hydroxymethylpterin diphosphokinase MptE-like protein [Anaeromusa sp.]MDD3158151.1 DUF115 domain-containing protein [Anaeromusa sp.]
MIKRKKKQAGKIFVEAARQLRQGELTRAEEKFRQVAAITPQLLAAAEECCFRSDGGSELVLGPAPNGFLTLRLRKDGQEVFLHDPDAPEHGGRNWAEKNRNQDPVWKLPALTNDSEAPQGGCLWLICGCGLGYHVRALQEMISEQDRIVVFEASPEADYYWFYAQCEPAAKAERFFASQVRHSARQVALFLQEYGLGQVRCLQYEPIVKTNEEAFAAFKDGSWFTALQDALQELQEEESEAWELVENAVHNVPAVLSQLGLRELQSRMKNIPAVLVAAGPSLNKNIDVLAQYQGRGLIIASGSAIGALKRKGITPHMLVVGDPFNRNFAELESSLDESLLLATSYYGMEKAVAAHTGSMLFFDFLDYPLPFPYPGMETIVPETEKLCGTASVATLSLDIAVKLGCWPIIFIGQDCALSEDADHAEGVLAHGYSGNPQEEMLWVPGYYGEQVRTIRNFYNLLQYFEQYLAKLPEGRVINATEGGAQIKGALQQPLQETLSALPVLDICLGELLQAPGMVRPGRDIWQGVAKTLVWRSNLLSCRSRIAALIGELEQTEQAVWPSLFLPILQESAYKQVAWALRSYVAQVKRSFSGSRIQQLEAMWQWGEASMAALARLEAAWCQSAAQLEKRTKALRQDLLG